MNDLIRRFERHLSVERNVSEHTLRAYMRDLEGFRAFLEENPPPRGEGITSVDHIVLRRYLARLHKRNSKSTIARKLASLRAFFRFLVREGVLTANPGELVGTPRQEKYLPTTLSVDEAYALMESGGGDDLLALRDRAILETLYSCGLRISELTGLDVERVDLHEGLVRVLGKGNKERIVPIGRQAREALARYLEARGNPAGDVPLFINRSGGRLTPRSVQRNLKRQLLHTRILKPATTQKYTRVSVDHLTAIYDKAHPRSRKK